MKNKYSSIKQKPIFDFKILKTDPCRPYQYSPHKYKRKGFSDQKDDYYGL